jgi:hypothetical protein
MKQSTRCRHRTILVLTPLLWLSLNLFWLELWRARLALWLQWITNLQLRLNLLSLRLRRWLVP